MEVEVTVEIPGGSRNKYLITARPIGVFWMCDEKGPDAKILAVPAGDARTPVTDISGLPELVLLEISHFFEIYKDLEPGKSSDVHGWEGRAEAEREIEASRERYRAR